MASELRCGLFTVGFRIGFWQNPVLPFLVFWKMPGKPAKKQGFFVPAEPLKSLEKKGKKLKKNKEFLAREKTRNSKKTKEGEGTDFFFCGFLFSGRRIFSRILSPEFFVFFCGKKCSEKSSKIYTTKITDTYQQVLDSKRGEKTPTPTLQPEGRLCPC